MGMQPGSFDNHYARLGVPFDATPEEIRRAYHRAAKLVHPDTNPGNESATRFLKLKESFEILSSEKARAAYDQSLLAVDHSPGVQLTTLLSRNRLVKTREPQLVYAMMRLNPLADKNIQKPPVNVCLVIDKSTSMSGKRMDVVKVSARRILQQLQPEDYLSIVTFSDRAEAVIEPSREVDIKKLDARISLMQTGGGTELFHGLHKGFQLLTRHLRSSAVNHLILITDGHTYGDEEKCLDLAEQIKESGISVSALGIGKEWNEQFLDKLAGRTGGTSVYVSNANDLKQFVEQKFSMLHKVIAENLRLEILNSEVNARIRYIFRVQPEPNRLDTDGLIALGNLAKNEALVFLVEIMVQDASSFVGQKVILECELRYDLPAREIPSTRTRFSIRLPVFSEDVPETPPQEIIQAMSKLTLYRMQEQARTEVDNGDVRAATRRLKFLAAQVEAGGDSTLANTILNEADRLEDGNAHLGRLEKSIMYGTKSLVAGEPGNFPGPSQRSAGEAGIEL